MREELAEQLLGNIMQWDIPTAKDEIPKLRYLAAVKYDNYRNFGVGKRFLESLVLWLRQFNTIDERKSAYDFIMNRLLYISENQMDHLVEIAYPQRIFPILKDQTISRGEFHTYQVKKIRNSSIFKEIKRKSLFLGMSDGARIDAFRRKHNLNNEQVNVSYELSGDKWKSMQKDLIEWLDKNKRDTNERIGNAYFENVFLIDDFSGSGKSILRIQDDKYKGKLPWFIDKYLGTRKNPGKLGKFCSQDGPKLFILTYIAAQKSVTYLKENINEFIRSYSDKPNVHSCEVLPPLQLIENKVPQPESDIDRKFSKLLEDYYDKRLEDVNTWTGGTDVKYGYAGCSLPIVLCHNCPNNSVYLLWGETEAANNLPGLKALFPRISRHLELR